MQPSNKLTIVAEPGCSTQAVVLAERLQLPLAAGVPREGQVLRIGTQGLALVTFGKGAPGPVYADFIGGTLAHRRRFGGGRQQDIARAVGLHRNPTLTVADLTAGLGRDAFVLASLGATVTLVERHTVVAALLQDGLQRARLHGDDPQLTAILARMVLVDRDSREWLAELSDDERPDVIYLDPMFPMRHKSAKVKKEMAVFQDIVGCDEDSGDLLALALHKARYRVVVKRPTGASSLAGRAPTLDIRGKSTRFDIYALQKLPPPDAS